MGSPSVLQRFGIEFNDLSLLKYKFSAYFFQVSFRMNQKIRLFDLYRKTYQAIGLYAVTIRPQLRSEPLELRIVGFGF